VPAGAAFYAEILGGQVQSSPSGLDLHAARGRLGSVAPVPERARAQGAPAHWFGQLQVDDVDAAAAAWTARGGQVLGPVQRAPEGDLAVVRDPQGAVLALAARPLASAPGVIVWHELHTTDVEAAWTAYEAFGWKRTESMDLGPKVGIYQMFTWASGTRSVGGMIATARAPEIHTHWIFYFDVANLDAAVARVGVLGGKTYSGPHRTPGGDRVAACEDPQGAVFGLREQQ